MVLKNPDGFDGSIAINHSDWFVGSPHRDADNFSRFMNTLLSKYTWCFLFVNRKLGKARPWGGAVRPEETEGRIKGRQEDR